MAQWAETCRRIFNIYYQYMLIIAWINYYIIAKHNGVATIKIMWYVLEVNLWTGARPFPETQGYIYYINLNASDDGKIQ